MHKEQIKDKIKEFITYARDEGVTDDEIYMFMDDVFPQAHWVFKTNKLTPLQVKACVCQQCPFPGELGTRCDWCDNPKMMEFLGLAIPAMGDFFQQHKAQALKEQMDWVMGVIDKYITYHKDRLAQCDDSFGGIVVSGAEAAKVSTLEALKAELEGKNA